MLATRSIDLLILDFTSVAYLSFRELHFDNSLFNMKQSFSMNNITIRILCASISFVSIKKQEVLPSKDWPYFIGVHSTTAKYMEESINNILKWRHNILLIISSENFAVPLYAPLYFDMICMTDFYFNF